MIKDIDVLTQFIMAQGMREVHIEIIDKDGNHQKFDYRAHTPTSSPERAKKVKGPDLVD